MTTPTPAPSSPDAASPDAAPVDTGTEIAAPTEPGTSPTYHRGRMLRRYGLWLAVTAAAFSMIWGGIGSLLLANQVQLLEFSRFFIGPDATVDLQQLTVLRDAVAAGTATATADEERLLSVLATFDASRASSLALVASISLIGTTIAQPLIGVLSDRTRSPLGRRAPWMLAGALIGAATIVAVRFAPNVAILVLLWTVASMALNAAASPFSATLADRIPERRRGGMSGLQGFGSFFGGVLGSVGAGAGLSAIGLNTYFVFAAVVVVCVVLFTLRVRDRSSVDLVVPSFSWRRFLIGFTYALRSHDFRWVWIARVLLTFGYGVSGALSFFMLQSYVQPALSQAEAVATAPLLALAGLPSTVVAILLAGALSDRLRRRKAFVFVASVLMAASMAVPLLMPSVGGLFLQTVLAGFAFGIYIPVDQALVIDVLPDEQAAGRDLGVAGVATNLGQALGPAVAGAVVAATGGYQAVWISALVLVAAAAVTILPVRRP